MQHKRTCRHHLQAKLPEPVNDAAVLPEKGPDECECVGEARWCEGILSFLSAQLCALDCSCLEWVSGSVHWVATCGPPHLHGECGSDAGTSDVVEILVRVGHPGEPKVLRVRGPVRCGKLDPRGEWTYQVDGNDGWSSCSPGAESPGPVIGAPCLPVELQQPPKETDCGRVGHPTTHGPLTLMDIKNKERSAHHAMMRRA